MCQLLTAQCSLHLLHMFFPEHMPLSLVWCTSAMKATVYCDKVLAFSGLLCKFMVHEQAKVLFRTCLASTLTEIIVV